MLFYGMNQGNFFDQVKADYAGTDAFHLAVGADVFGGCLDGRYGRYKDNTQCGSGRRKVFKQMKNRKIRFPFVFISLRPIYWVGLTVAF